jgi:hypothetical protein
MMVNKGKISQIIGPVVDVSFNESGSTLPKIYKLLRKYFPLGDIPLSHFLNSPSGLSVMP